MSKTIVQLTDATTVNAADELIIQQGGITKRATASELATGLAPLVNMGCFLTVAGAGVAGANLSARVTAVSGSTITLNTNASTTVAGAAVTYTAPVFNGFGAIQA